jgi:periplasmic protein TonB
MVSAPACEKGQGFLDSCLLGGDAAQEKRARRVKQRALLISIVLQILVVAALVLMPLLSKGENIAGRVLAFPTLPYIRGGSHAHRPTSQSNPLPNRPACHFCQPTRIPQGIVTVDPNRTTDSESSDISEIPGAPEGAPEGVSADILGVNTHPAGRVPDTIRPTSPPRIRVGSIEPAMLVHRVEPQYPPLARQIRHEGRVELHAIVATDGTIQSLEIVSGDPLLIQSALAAVREWRYRPTILNGQAVEVDTHITVIYTLSHE